MSRSGLLASLVSCAALAVVLPAGAHPAECRCEAVCASEVCEGGCRVMGFEGTCACEPAVCGEAAACEVSEVDSGVLRVRRTRTVCGTTESTHALWACAAAPDRPETTWRVVRYSTASSSAFPASRLTVLGASAPELGELQLTSDACEARTSGWPAVGDGTAVAASVTEVVFVPGKAVRAVDAWPVVRESFSRRRVAAADVSGPVVVGFQTRGLQLVEARVAYGLTDDAARARLVQHLNRTLQIRYAAPVPPRAEGFLVVWLEGSRIVQLDLGLAAVERGLAAAR